MQTWKTGSAAVAAALFAGGPAHAVVVAQDVTILLAGEPSMPARIDRDGEAPSTWASPRAFPGIDGSSTGPFPYRNIPILFAPNAHQDIYYELSWRTFTTFNPHMVAYLDTMDPLNPGLNYLGDYGATPFPAGGFRSFQVIVPAGRSLLLNFVDTFGEVPGGLPAAFEYRVEAFSDADRNENFTSAIPEPATWGLLIAGFGVVGVALRRRQPQQARLPV